MLSDTLYYTTKNDINLRQPFRSIDLPQLFSRYSSRVGTARCFCAPFADILEKAMGENESCSGSALFRSGIFSHGSGLWW